MLMQLGDDLGRAARRFQNAMDAPRGVEVVQIGKSYYPKERVDRLYSKLTTPPIIADSDRAHYYKGDRVRGYINKDAVYTDSIANSGSVSFQTHYPETGWDYSSPEELGMQTASPRPIREMAKMARGFENLLDSNQGRGVFTNSPISEHRGKAYQKVGFEQVVPGSQDPRQFLDNRRFKNNKALAEVYVKGDVQNLDSELSNATAQGLLDKHLGLANTRNYVLDQQELKNFMEMRGNRGLPYENAVEHYDPKLDDYDLVPGIEVTRDIPEHNYYAAQSIDDRSPIALSPEYILGEVRKRGMNPEAFVSRAYRDHSPEWGDRFADMAHGRQAGASRKMREVKEAQAAMRANEYIDNTPQPEAYSRLLAQSDHLLNRHSGMVMPTNVQLPDYDVSPW